MIDFVDTGQTDSNIIGEVIRIKKHPIRLTTDLYTAYGLKAQVYLPVPPREICELHYYVDDVSGDERGLD